MKKLLSVLLAVVMLFTMAVPSFSASAAEKVVNIYVMGYGSALYDETGKQVFPVELGLVDKLKEVLDELLLNLASGMLFGDYDDYCDQLYELMGPGYDDVRLDKNGECTDENGNHYFGLGRDPLSLSNHKNGLFDGGYYRFEYDWRLSPEYNANLLEKFIDIVLSKSKATKVNLIGRCLGGTIVSCYLQNASETSLKKIKKVSLYIPSTAGLEFLSALFSGNIVLNPDTIDNYLKYSLRYNNTIGSAIGDELFEALVTIVEFANEAYILGLGTDVIEDIVNAIKDNALARIVRDSYGSFPSFWSMVGADYIDEAVNLIYGTDELKAEYAGMIEKIYSYRNNVQVNAEKRMLELKEKGIEFMIVSKYNFVNFPISADADKHSDGVVSTTATTFGATTSNFGETLSKKYIDSISDENKKYLSPDNMIDASTALFPETTWFIKNLPHGTFPSCGEKLISKFLTSDNMTIDTYEEYPQYLKYDKDNNTLSPVTGIDDGDILPTGNDKKVPAFIRFFTFLFNLLKKLISGELQLGGMLG